jgi:hypothetical protein
MRRLLIGAAFVVAACGGSGGDSGGAGEAAGGGGVDPARVSAVAQACTEYSNLDVEICECMGERAVANLDEAQVELLVTSMLGDGAAADIMTDEMGPVKAAQAVGVMTSAPMLCAAELGPE